MLRGFRWQIIALLLAAITFAFSLWLRGTGEVETTPTSMPRQLTAGDVSDAVSEGMSNDSVVEVSVTTDSPAVANAPAAQPLPADDPNALAVFREALVGRVQRLNPLLAGLNPVDRDITSLIFEGLARTNAYGEPVPALAERWIISSDSLEYIVFLRDDVLWHDGTPFTAADVIYTMSILRSADFTGPEDLGAFWRTVETVQLSENAVRFRLTQPLGTFLDKLRIGILPEHALRGTTAEQLDRHPFNLSPIGTGPYQFESIGTQGGQIRQVNLRPAPVYRQRPEGQAAQYAIDRFAFEIYDTFDAALQALQQGEASALAARSPAERRPLFMAAINSDLELHNALEATLGVLIFNWQNPRTTYFRDQRVRVALETGLDRTAIIERTLANLALVADSPILPGSWAYQPNLPWADYDPAQARLLLEQALERLGSLPNDSQQVASEDEVGQEDATPVPTPTTYFQFTILTPDDPALVSLAQEVAAQWSQINLTVTVAAADPVTYRARLESGQFDVALVEYSLGGSADPDVYPFWHQGQYPDGFNYGGADDRRVSELLERSRRDPYGINRVADYREFQRIFAERAIALPMYYPLFTYSTQPYVEGVQLGFIGSPSDRFRNIGDWHFTGY
ncbi:MAG: peptide ABC transporter substrate-binding protein [Aggregatilineales bacterium]